jgi:hypothetical protein
MKSLIDEKREIVEKHMDRLGKSYLEVLKLKERAVRDSRLDVNFSVGVLDKVKVLVDPKSERLLNMDPEQRIQYAAQWSEDAKTILDTLKNHGGYESLLGDIDRQLKTYEKELVQINEELKKCDDEYRRKSLEREREHFERLA